MQKSWAIRTIGFAVVCMVLLSPVAAAHKLVPDDGTHIDMESALEIEDPNLSQVA
ncbi:MAG: hypothetical protein QG656_1828, partial [Candidatus Hydrogenedentes bacterium]|nr:hypothetical protein [Candidatus Hydrogenedentota bacterium]